jgi:hypothetical protein
VFEEIAPFEDQSGTPGICEYCVEEMYPQSRLVAMKIAEEFEDVRDKLEKVVKEKEGFWHTFHKHKSWKVNRKDKYHVVLK